MEGKDPVKELFSQKLGNHEVPVNPELWSSIASQIPAVTSTAVVSTGFSLGTKFIIGISVAASLAAGIYFFQSDNKGQEVKTINKTKQSVEDKQSNKIENKIENSGVENKKEKDVEFYVNEDKLVIQNTIDQDYKNELITIGENTSTNAVNEVMLSPSNTEIQTTTEVKVQQENKREEHLKVNESRSNLSSEIKGLTLQNNSNSLPKESAIQLILPNVFTPNGDGTNDYLELKITEISEFSVVVLNENGQVIFQSQDLNFRWDGLLPNGDKASRGNYVYYVTGKDSDGNLISKHSRLTVSY